MPGCLARAPLIDDAKTVIRELVNVARCGRLPIGVNGEYRDLQRLIPIAAKHRLVGRGKGEPDQGHQQSGDAEFGKSSQALSLLLSGVSLLIVGTIQSNLNRVRVQGALNVAIPLIK